MNFEQGQDLSATFSNYGQSQVDLFAPGVSIYATTPGDDYQYLQGTSMAAPVVAGVAAMVRSYYPALSAAQVKDLLMSTTVKKKDAVLIPGQDGKTASFSTLSVFDLENSSKIFYNPHTVQLQYRTVAQGDYPR